MEAGIKGETHEQMSGASVIKGLNPQEMTDLVATIKKGLEKLVAMVEMDAPKDEIIEKLGRLIKEL